MNKKIHDIVNVISAIFITAVLIFIFLNTDLLGRVFVSFFLAIALLSDVWLALSILGKNEYLPTINIIMILIFLAYWFTFLAFASYWAIINESYSLFIVIVQIVMIYYGGNLFRTSGLLPREFFIMLMISFSVIPIDFIRKMIYRKFNFKVEI